jgi:GTP-binding protein HflX
VTHPNAKEQAASVLETLVEIEADHVPMLTVLNKIDRLKDPEKATDAMVDFADTVAISALRGDGIGQLLNSVSEKLYEAYTPITVNLPYKEGALIAMFHDQALIDSVENKRESVRMSGRLPGRLVARFMPFVDGKEENTSDEF